ncbi:hypothetical protein NIES22_44230 [Calothrix brevissima NIES-22]|nr:hypothetical protein NIES22_44230 [Calothrix brevissima NIES-22]
MPNNEEKTADCTNSQIEETEQYWNSDEEMLKALYGDLPYFHQFYKRFDGIDGIVSYFSDSISDALDNRIPSSDAIENKVKNTIRLMHDLACVEWKYCEKKEFLKSEGFQLSVAIADGLLSLSTGLPIPLTAMSVFFVKKGLLEKLCSCENTTAQ